MSLKINRGGIMAMEGLEAKIESALQEDAVSADAKAAGAEPGAVTEGTELTTATTGAEGTPGAEGAAGAPAAEDTPKEGGESGVKEEGTTAPAGDKAAEQVGGGDTPVATGTVANVEDAPAAAGSGNAIVELDVKVPDTDVETHILGMEGIAADIEQAIERIDVAEGVDETIDGINTELQTSIDENEGFAPGAARALEVCVERMKADVGFGASDKVVWPALENFGGKKSKVEGTKEALKHNREFQKRLKKGMRIAQEGLGEKIVNGWKSFFATEEKLLGRLQVVSSAYDQGTVGTDQITAPAWGKILNASNKGTITGADVVALLAELNKRTTNGALVKSLDQLVELQKKVADTLRRGKFIANDKDVMALKEMVVQTNQLSEEVMGIVGTEAKTRDANFVPMDAAAKKKAVQVITVLLDPKPLIAALNNLDDATTSAIFATVDNSRLAGQMADDMKEAANAMRMASNTIGHVHSLMRYNVRVSHAAIAYMGASVRKGAAPAAAK